MEETFIFFSGCLNLICGTFLLMFEVSNNTGGFRQRQDSGLEVGPNRYLDFTIYHFRPIFIQAEESPGNIQVQVFLFPTARALEKQDRIMEHFIDDGLRQDLEGVDLLWWKRI